VRRRRHGRLEDDDGESQRRRAGRAVEGSPDGRDQGRREELLPSDLLLPRRGRLDDDPFEDSLRGLGCSTPANYTEATGTGNWWLYTRCPPSRELEKLVCDYSHVAPYDARFIDSLCLELAAIGSGKPDSVFVEFDPTCETCIVSGQ